MDFVIFGINFLFSVLYVLLIVRALLPWMPRIRIGLVQQATEPLLRVIRMGLPPLRMGMDVSPFIAIILLWILQRVLLNLLSNI